MGTIRQWTERITLGAGSVPTSIQLTFEADHVDIGRHDDLRGLRFEARSQVYTTADQRGDNDHEEKNNDGKLAAGAFEG